MKPVSSTVGRWVLLLISAAGLAGCENEIAPVPICDPPWPSVTPSSATVRPGETVSYAASGPIPLCNGSTLANPTFRWTTSNPRVATIDSLTGLATARDTGQTTLIVRIREDPNLQGAAAIVVRP